MRSVMLALVLAGCAAPPVGFGSSARIPAPPGHVSVEGRTAVGVGPGRRTYQAELSGMFRVRRWFGIEYGAVYTRTSQDVDGGDEVALQGVFPFMRPRVFVDRVSLAVGLAGLGMGGGGGGIIGGIADAQLGYGTSTWSLYVGGYRHYYELVTEASIEASSSQLRVGGQYTVRVGRGRIGLALELHRQRDRLRDDTVESSSRFLGAGIKLSFTSPELR